MSFSRSLFEKGGAIASRLEGYEIRTPQLRMVEAVEEAINGRQNLIVEAGAGVGKSLAYLVPFVNWAVRERKKVVISTNTKALQNQLFIKDLPFLSRVLDLKFRFAICMGSENYVCLRKAYRNYSPGLFRTKKQKKGPLRDMALWLSKTETGLVTDMDFVPDRSIWEKFSRESDLCLGRKCPYRDRCFYRKARQKQARAHILVTNHSLLFADITSEARVLPDFQGLVLDEAHTLEDIAVTYFGKEVSKTGLRHLLGDISGLISAGELRPGNGQCHIAEKRQRVKQRIEELRVISDGFFKKAEAVFGKEDRVIQFDREQFSAGDMSGALRALSLTLKELVFALKADAGRNLNGDMEEGYSDVVLFPADFGLHRTEKSGAGIMDREVWHRFQQDESCEMAKTYAERCGRLSESLDFIFGHENGKYVRWVDVKVQKSGINYSFHAVPIDISGHMKTCLFEKVCPVILTSATLSLSSREPNFSFIKGRLGVDSPMELLVGSPFDYARNVLVYLPCGMADPNKDLVAFRQQVQQSIMRIYDIIGGRIFALFTSYEMLNEVAGNITRERHDINILKQGELPRYVLLDVFKRSHDSILMGTMTFWQGVDVPGSSLECVIITKLPFSVPTDPINAARIKFMRDQGLNPFEEYQVPQAVIMFKQGFGRLIRKHSDRGVVVVLDPRIRTRYYGREFINALPECPHTDDIRKVRNFFSLLRRK